MNMKNIAMWAIIVFLTIGLYNMFKNPQANVKNSNQVIFSDFLTSVENGEVISFTNENQPFLKLFHIYLEREKPMNKAATAAITIICVLFVGAGSV